MMKPLEQSPLGMLDTRKAVTVPDSYALRMLLTLRWYAPNKSACRGCFVDSLDVVAAEIGSLGGDNNRQGEQSRGALALTARSHADRFLGGGDKAGVTGHLNEHVHTYMDPRMRASAQHRTCVA